MNDPSTPASHQSHPTSLVLCLAAIGLAVAFLAGRMSVSESVAGGAPSSEDSLESLRQRLLAAARDREALRERVTQLSTMREEMGKAAASRPSSTQAGLRPAGEGSDTTPEPAKAAPPKPAVLLAQVKEFLASGKTDDLASLAPALQEQSELLVPELVALLEGADSLFAKERLAELLGNMKDKRAVPVLQDLLKRETDDAVLTATIRALGQVPDPSSVSLLAKQFGREGGSPMPPSVAATSLGSIGSADAIQALRKEVQEGKNGMVRAFAIRALADREDKALVPFFLEEAQRTQGVSDRHRKSAIDAIARTGDKSAVYKLTEIAFSPKSSKAVQESAKRAINRLSGKKIYDV